MESNTVTRQNSESDAPEGQIVISILLVAAIECDFVFKLIHVLNAHALMRYIGDVCLFQFGVVMFGVAYWRCWKKLIASGVGTREINDILGRISYIVMCLLFSLMAYSSFTAFGAQYK